MLRCFRHYIRHRLETTFQIKPQSDQPDEIKCKIRNLLTLLASPAGILTEKSVTQLFIMLYPSVVLQCYGPTLGLQSWSEQDAAETESLFFRIFRENSAAMRSQFFSHPLVRFLWTIFSNESPSSLFEYMERLRNQQDGEARLQTVFDEIKRIEDSQPFVILPEGVREI